MGLATEFIGWMHNRFASNPNYRLIHPHYEPMFACMDLSFERTGSMTKGKQTLCLKVLPPNLTPEQAMQLAAERQAVFRTKCKFFKLLQDFVVFFYVTDAPIPLEIVSYLADFQRVEKVILGNSSQLRFLLETAGGTYLMPERSGWFGWLPIKNLRGEIQQEILEPFRVWRQQQSHPQQ